MKQQVGIHNKWNMLVRLDNKCNHHFSLQTFTVHALSWFIVLSLNNLQFVLLQKWLIPFLSTRNGSAIFSFSVLLSFRAAINWIEINWTNTSEIRHLELKLELIVCFQFWIEWTWLNWNTSEARMPDPDPEWFPLSRPGSGSRIRNGFLRKRRSNCPYPVEDEGFFGFGKTTKIMKWKPVRGPHIYKPESHALEFL